MLNFEHKVFEFTLQTFYSTAMFVYFYNSSFKFSVKPSVSCSYYEDIFSFTEFVCKKSLPRKISRHCDNLWLYRSREEVLFCIWTVHTKQMLKAEQLLQLF